MANVALSENIRKAGDALFGAMKDSLAAHAIKAEDGKVDVKLTKRALGYALKSYLRSTGQIATRASVSHSVDWANVINAAVYCFTKEAKTASDALPLMQICYGAVAAMATPFTDYDKARKLVREALDREGCPLVIVQAKGVGQATVKLRDGAKLSKPVEPTSWETMLGAGSSEDDEEDEEAEEAAAPANGKTAKGKGKGKGK